MYKDVYIYIYIYIYIICIYICSFINEAYLKRDFEDFAIKSR